MSRRHKPLLPEKIYFQHLWKGIFISFSLVAFSLLMGMAGYMYFGRLGIVDSLLNASMILTGMGPVDIMKSNAAKVFASFYALYSGVAFLTIAAFLFAPLYRRFLHRFHLEIDNDEEN